MLKLILSVYLILFSFGIPFYCSDYNFKSGNFNDNTCLTKTLHTSIYLSSQIVMGVISYYLATLCLRY